MCLHIKCEDFGLLGGKVENVEGGEIRQGDKIVFLEKKCCVLKKIGDKFGGQKTGRR